MKLLVIEDDLDLRRQLVTALTDSGYTVEEAEDGEEGLYLGNEFPYDLAIVDIGLPKLSGVEVIRRWRENDINFPI
ncbi:response regulator, partial [Gilvimarinus sp. SDUM040013]